MNKIDRSNVNDSKVKAQDFPKSGFDLTYKSRMDFVLGRLIPSGYQHIMPADKFSGSNKVEYTFNELNVPQISDVEVSQHNFFVPYRSIDTSFIDGIVPTELNGMSASWHTPTFNLQDIVTAFLEKFHISSTTEGGETVYLSINDVYQLYFQGENPSSYDSDTVAFWMANINTYYATLYDDYYCQDWFEDYLQYVQSVLVAIPDNYNVTNPVQFTYLWLSAWLIPIFGKNSLLDLLGYQYLRTYDLLQMANDIQSAHVNSEFPDLWEFVDGSIEQNEYALRAYYAIWYEWYRDPNLEKRSANLPDWRKFGSTSIFSGMLDLKPIAFLFTRIRSWQKDMFVGSMPDDISRHVWAPISAQADDSVAPISTANYDYNYAESDQNMVGASYVNSRTYTLGYIDPITGTTRNIYCPVPSAVNDSLIALSSTQGYDTYILDLRDLRKSQMLERYLKRNFYFGDEYQDRMLAHYGSKVSDNSIRRPHLLSSSVSSVNPKQEVANMTNDVTKAGTRIATCMDSAQGDAYEFFAEEFGIVINITSIRPIAQYAGICPQNLLYQQTDFPLPEFANNNDEFGRNLEVAVSGYNSNGNVPGAPQFYQFGHYPYAHAYRSRVDEVHGSFLDDRIDYTFARFFGADKNETTPKLNYRFIHCRPRLGMFFDTIRFDGQGYMTCINNFYVERVLPTTVEEI